MLRHALVVIAALLAIKDGFAATESRMPTYCLVVSPASPVRDIQSADARRIFLGTRTRWPGGRSIAVVLPPEQSAARTFLLRRLAELSNIDFSQQWVGQVFRGAVARGPVTASSVQELRQLVSGSIDAIGLIDCRDVDPSLRPLSIDGKHPQDPGYRLGE